jgi:hypothetical protein
MNGGRQTMTRRELINRLDEIREEIALASSEDLTDYAREKAYMCIAAAIDYITENDEE